MGSIKATNKVVRFDYGKVKSEIEKIEIYDHCCFCNQYSTHFSISRVSTNALYNCYSGLSIHLFSFIHKSAFLFSKGLLCLYYKQNNRRLLVDMEFFFSCSTRHLSRSLCSLVSYRVKHSKRNSMSTRAHVLFSISRSSFLTYFINNIV